MTGCASSCSPQRAARFCAGFELKEFAKPELAKTIRDSSHRYHLYVSGCDMRIATSNAVFAHPEIKFGAPPLFTPLQWIVGAGIARELCLTCRRVDAAEAHRIGLVNAVVEAERLEEEAMATARVMAEAPQPALEATKRYLVSNAGVTFDEAFAIEHDRVFDQFLLGDLGP